MALSGFAQLNRVVIESQRLDCSSVLPHGSHLHSRKSWRSSLLEALPVVLLFLVLPHLGFHVLDVIRNTLGELLDVFLAAGIQLGLGW